MSGLAPRLYLVADRGVFSGDAEWLAALKEVAALLQPGEALQVRLKTPPGPERSSLLQRARQAVERANAPVFVNGTPAEALEHGYSAVHLPEVELGHLAVLPQALATAASIHSIEALQMAEAAGLDFVVAGAVFPPGSHDGPGRGLHWLAGIVLEAHIPVVAIGGITLELAPACLGTGAVGVAVVTGIMLAAQRDAALEAYRRALASVPEPRPAGGSR